MNAGHDTNVTVIGIGIGIAIARDEPAHEGVTFMPHGFFALTRPHRIRCR